MPRWKERRDEGGGGWGREERERFVLVLIPCDSHVE